MQFLSMNPLGVATHFRAPIPIALTKPSGEIKETAATQFSSLMESLSQFSVSRSLAAKIMYPTSDGPEWEERRKEMEDEGGVRMQAESPDGSLLDGILFPACSTGDPLSQKAIIFVPGMDGYYEDGFSHYLIDLFKEKLGNINVLILNHPSVMASKGELTCVGMALTAFTGCKFLIEGLGLKANDLIVYGQSLGGVAATRGTQWVQMEHPEAEMKLINERSFHNLPDVVGDGVMGLGLKYGTEKAGFSTPDLVEAFDAIKGEKLVIYSPYDGMVLKAHSLFQKLYQRGLGQKVSILEMEGETVKKEEHWRTFTPKEEERLIMEIRRMLGLGFEREVKVTKAPQTSDAFPFADMMADKIFS